VIAFGSLIFAPLLPFIYLFSNKEKHNDKQKDKLKIQGQKFDPSLPKKTSHTLRISAKSQPLKVNGREIITPLIIKW